MPTPAELRKLADRAEMHAGRLAGEAAALRKQAHELRRLAAEGERLGLRSMQDKGTLGVPEMHAETASRSAKVSMARTRNPWPFHTALHRRNLSVPEWARAQKGLTVEAAKSWLKRPSHGGRPIPRAWAEAIAGEFLAKDGSSEVPAVPESWPNGIR